MASLNVSFIAGDVLLWKQISSNPVICNKVWYSHPLLRSKDNMCELDMHAMQKRRKENGKIKLHLTNVHLKSKCDYFLYVYILAMT
jgi:hypothetical protein